MQASGPGTFPTASDEELVESFHSWHRWHTGALARPTDGEVVNAARAVAQELRKRGLFGEVIAGLAADVQDWLIDNRI